MSMRMRKYESGDYSFYCMPFSTLLFYFLPFLITKLILYSLLKFQNVSKEPSQYLV